MRRVLLALVALSLLGIPAAPARAGGPRLMVFAAASTTNALQAIGRRFGQGRGMAVRNSFASSSTLAKQIARGAPADVFVSANPKWMDYLQARGLLAPGTRVNLLGNRLVLIAPRNSRLSRLEPRPGLDLSPYLREGPLAMGDPSHVPAGIYGRAALESLGMWQQVQGRVAAAANVRMALALVELGEAPLGLVYASDALVSDKVKVVGRFPASSHPAIVYPAAILAGRDTPAARAFLEFLQGPQAAAVFRRYGFWRP